MFERMSPEYPKLGRYYLYYKPPWLVPPPSLSFDPSIDMRRLGRPKTEQDKHERALCRAWKKVEGRARAKKLREEMELAFEKEVGKALDRIVELSEEIGELRIKTELGWLAIEAEAIEAEVIEAEGGGEGLVRSSRPLFLSFEVLMVALQSEDNM